MSTIHGRNLVHPSALAGTATNIIGGVGISVSTSNGDTIISTLAPYPHPVTSITAGHGLIAHNNGQGDVRIDTIIPITPVPTSKPIFMVGLPSTSSPSQFEKTSIGLVDKLTDYHVLVLRNTTDVYTAKLFSERDGDTLPISDIKKYIDQKLR